MHPVLQASLSSSVPEYSPGGEGVGEIEMQRRERQ